MQSTAIPFAFVAMLLLAACGDDAGDSAGDIDQRIAEARDVMESVETVRFSQEVAVELAGEENVTTSEGRVDLVNGRVHMDMETPGGETTTVVDGVETYQRMDDGTWFSFSNAELFADDLAEHWQAFMHATDVTEVGEDEVRGEPATQFEVVVPAEEAVIVAVPVWDADAGAVLDEDLVVNVWIGDDGYIVRSEFFDELVGSIQTTEYFDFGEPVEVELPPADEVQDSEDYLGNPDEARDAEAGGIDPRVADLGEVMGSVDTLSFTTEVAAGEDVTTIEGAVDVVNDQAQIEVHTPAGDNTVVIDGEVTYQRMPDGTWASYASADHTQVMLVPSAGEDWDAYLSTDDVTEVGDDEVRGEPATQFELVLPAEAVNLVGNQDAVDNGDLVAGKVTTNVWIDNDGRLVRQAFIAEGGDEVGEVTSVTEYFAFDDPVAVEVPPEDDVEDWSDDVDDTFSSGRRSFVPVR